MKLSTFSKFNFFKTMSQCQLLLQYSTTPAIKQTESAESLLLEKKEKNNVLFEPALTADTLEALNDITSVTVAVNNVSWAKISVPNMSLFDWNAITLPSKFPSASDDANILALANSIIQSIPKSDMYVVENCVFRSLTFRDHLLRTALIVLLNAHVRDVGRPSKIVFQKPVILNSLCDILVGNERASASRIVKSMLKSSRSWNDNAIETENTLECFSLVKIDEKQKQTFLSSDLAKQESLSLALLITLTFSELNIIQSSTSISKIQNKLHSNRKKAPVKNL